jgi:hypothetical protein
VIRYGRQRGASPPMWARIVLRRNSMEALPSGWSGVAMAPPAE